VHHFWLMGQPTLPTRKLCGFEFLSRSEHSPQLHFAIDFASVSSDRISTPCRVCRDGKPVVRDSPADRVTTFVHRSQPAAPTARGRCFDRPLFDLIGSVLWVEAEDERLIDCFAVLLDDLGIETGEDPAFTLTRMDACVDPGYGLDRL
jgi:hypothetical protein